MKNAIIFDLDGTLLYTLEDLTDSVNFALNQFNYPHCSIEQIRSFVGNGVEKLIRRAILKSQDEINERVFYDCLNTFKIHYKNNMKNKTTPYSGVIDLLKKLKSKGIKIAVVSNKFDSAVKDLCTFYFGDLIDLAIGESNSCAKKPTPDGIFKVLKHFELKAKNCVYIGDSEVDIQTATNANMDCINVDWGYKDKNFLINAGAKRIVSNTKELEQLLLWYLITTSKKAY